MLSFIAGIVLGGVVGLLMMCFVTIAKETDAQIEDCEYEVIHQKPNVALSEKNAGKEI